jgi:hypothetical protein
LRGAAPARRAAVGHASLHRGDEDCDVRRFARHARDSRTQSPRFVARDGDWAKVRPPAHVTNQEENMSNTLPTRSILAAGVAAASLSAATFAGDSTSWLYLPCGSTEGIASFSAMVTYSWTGGSTASISIDLLNNTEASLGGYITAIALNGAPGSSAMSFVSCTSAAFQGLEAPVTGSPYGDFMSGASTGDSWLGGGSPNSGLSIGQSATFVFSLSGSSALLSGLTAQDCLDSTGYAMAVRFRGGEDGWSDKVVGCAVPAPGAAALIALAGMATRRRRA